MSERRSVEFDQFGYNIVCDEDRGTMTLQFTSSGGEGARAVRRLLRAVEERYGGGEARWSRRKEESISPLILLRDSRPHEDASDVLCFEMGVKPGERMDLVLADFLAFVSRQPGYRRTLGGPPEDARNTARGRSTASDDLSQRAADLLRPMFYRRGKDSTQP